MLSVIYEDDDILVIDKPAGVATLAKADSELPSVEDQLLTEHPACTELPECGIAHRLDNDTSGIICIGKTPAAYESLRLQMSDGSAEKQYTALVVGTVIDDGSIDAPVAHHPRKKNKMIVCESAKRARELKARPATTSYKVVDHVRKGTDGYTLLDVVIGAGVRHQIRAHLASIGHPLAGDRLYQNAAKRAADTLRLTRHMLHASSVTIQHPISGIRMSFNAPLPHDLESATSHP